MRSVDRPDDALAGVVEALPVGIFALDPDGRAVLWNSTAERLTGWPAAEVIGQGMSAGTTLDVPTAARILDELRAGRSYSGKLPATPRTGRSVIYGRLFRREGCTVFRWSNAGHPAPLLVEPGAAPRVLAGVDVVLGVDPTTGRTDREVALPPGSTLVLYTDGLVERRSDPDDEALGSLLDLVGDAVDRPLPAFCDHVVRECTADTGDDIAVPALRVER